MRCARPYSALIVALALSVSGCQFASTAGSDTGSVSVPTSSGSPSETADIHPESGLKRRHISLQGNNGNSSEILAEIADEPEAHARGLMFREQLPEGEGMLFVFPGTAFRSFWMKNTLIPLDIIFFNAAGVWVSGVTMTPCEADPCPSYPSENPAKYALEIPAGSIGKWGVGEGWKLVIRDW